MLLRPPKATAELPLTRSCSPGQWPPHAFVQRCPTRSLLWMEQNVLHGCTPADPGYKGWPMHRRGRQERVFFSSLMWRKWERPRVYESQVEKVRNGKQSWLRSCSPDRRFVFAFARFVLGMGRVGFWYFRARASKMASTHAVQIQNLGWSWTYFSFWPRFPHALREKEDFSLFAQTSKRCLVCVSVHSWAGRGMYGVQICSCLQYSFDCTVVSRMEVTPNNIV